MATDDSKEIQQQLDTLRSGIRQVAHDISTPLGVLRMVAYYLQSNQTDNEKREHYFKVINQNVAKVEANLDRLRELGEKSSPDPGPATPGGEAKP